MNIELDCSVADNSVQIANDSEVINDASSRSDAEVCEIQTSTENSFLSASGQTINVKYMPTSSKMDAFEDNSIEILAAEKNRFDCENKNTVQMQLNDSCGNVFNATYNSQGFIEPYSNEDQSFRDDNFEEGPCEDSEISQLDRDDTSSPELVDLEQDAADDDVTALYGPEGLSCNLCFQTFKTVSFWAAQLAVQY